MTPVLTAIPGILFITLCYAVLCAVSPFGNCRKCGGLGFQLRTTRRGRPKRGKHCRRCHGHGRRIRIGRWIFNRAARLYREGNPRPNSQEGAIR
ncbi:hypothetical protein AN219_37595 [Streptomyces nanshensis]|nr:hypothetical protein AN219_37595 [Streptomyces nanshensis]